MYSSKQSRYGYQEVDDYQSQCLPNGYESSSPQSMRSLPLRTTGHRASSTSSVYYTSPASSYESYGSSYGLGYLTSPTPVSTSPISTTGPSHPQQQQQREQQQPSQQQPVSKEYICLYPSCPHTSSRKADLERHVKFTHNRDTVSLVDCWDPACYRRGAYGFTRKDKMVDHMRKVHKADIPKTGGGSGAEPSRKGSQGW